ncbi:NAD(P)-binding protein [Athelia psychrophila]|uniref:NAD(P)-binding protein n=1 Tax=Athelia psychrophila TaxID=1759441 RepID=A0A166HYC2_9AGAM|nr:NAD(P)-binding protein [Fibularhizoctonia sp. CBS 109695]
MADSKPLVLITGVTGFLAQHVVAATQQAGYRVRGTVRSESKSAPLLAKFPQNFETIVVPDIANSDLSAALEGVTYILHTASPYTFTITNGEEDLLKPAIHGTLNVLRAAKKAGVKKVVITSSFAAISDLKGAGPWGDREYTEKDWNPYTYDEAAAPGVLPGIVYSAGKKLAEKAAWAFAEENQLKLVALNPPMIYGPALQDAATSPETLNTSSAAIYALFSGRVHAIPDDRLPLFCDVRDVARAHVLALETDAADGERVPLCGGAFTWKEATEELYATRPELKDRLVPLNSGNPAPGPVVRISTRVAREKLGLTEFIGWKKSLSDTVDSILELEKKWKSSS